MKKHSAKVAKKRTQKYDFKNGVRGKYAARFAKGTNLVALAPDVAKVFPDSESVNDALRVLVRLSQRTRRRKLG